MLVPSALVSTEPVTTMLAVKSPSTSSVAVAPASVKVSPTCSVIVSSPDKVITGAIVSATMTVLVSVAVLPALSVAE